jgi:hypothetical protein
LNELVISEKILSYWTLPRTALGQIDIEIQQGRRDGVNAGGRHDNEELKCQNKWTLAVHRQNKSEKKYGCDKEMKVVGV